MAATAGALEALAWAYSTAGNGRLAVGAALVAVCSPGWWRSPDDAGGIDLEAQPLVNQLLAGELPWVLADQFPELKPCHELATTGSAALARGIGELLDGEGLPQARRLAIFRPLLASWTRARTIGGKSTWDSAAEKQYAHALTELVRLSRADGRQVFASGSADAWSAKMLKQALGLVDSGRLERPRRKVLPPARPRSGAVARPDKDAAVHGDWAEMAVLQPGWQCGGPKLTLAYGDRVCRVELEVDGEILWSGPWQFELEADGRRLVIDSDWEEVCWVSDEDGDHVEIEAHLTDGFRLQRQLTLLRKDWVLLAADAVIGPTGDEVPVGARPVDRLTYGMSLPLGETMRVRAGGRNPRSMAGGQETPLVGAPLVAAGMADRPPPRRAGGRRKPAGATATRPGPESLRPALDRLGPQAGQTGAHLAATDRGRPAAAVVVGRRGRVSRPDRPPAMARLPLAGPAFGRTVLGQNLGTEFLLARFLRDGTIERRIEIE